MLSFPSALILTSRGIQFCFNAWLHCQDSQLVTVTSMVLCHKHSAARKGMGLLWVRTLQSRDVKRYSPIHFLTVFKLFASMLFKDLDLVIPGQLSCEMKERHTVMWDLFIAHTFRWAVSSPRTTQDRNEPSRLSSPDSVTAGKIRKTLSILASLAHHNHKTVLWLWCAKEVSIDKSLQCATGRELGRQRHQQCLDYCNNRVFVRLAHGQMILRSGPCPRLPGKKKQKHQWSKPCRPLQDYSQWTPAHPNLSPTSSHSQCIKL